MNTATLNSATQPSLRQQAASVWQSLGDFARALFAAQTRSFAVEEGLTDMLTLAQKYEQYYPSLSAELRAIAAKG